MFDALSGLSDATGAHADSRRAALAMQAIRPAAHHPIIGQIAFVAKHLAAEQGN